MPLLFAFVGSVFTGMTGFGAPRMLALGGAFVAVALFFSLVYLDGLSAVGGAIGAVVRNDPDLDPQTAD